MRKSNIFTGIFLLTLLIFSSCKDETIVEEVVNEFKLDKKELVLSVNGESANVTIKDGNGGYEIGSYDKSVIEVTLKGKTITVKPIKAGTVDLTVTDSKKKVCKIKVNVGYADISVEKTKIDLPITKSSEIKILDGSGEYEATVKDNKKNITFKVENSLLIIKAEKVGDVEILLKDKNTGKLTTIFVKVLDAKELEVDKKDLKIILNQKSEIIISDKEGSGDYSATIKDDKSVISIKSEDNKINVSGLKLGNAVILITDNITKSKVEVNVSVIKASEITVDKTEKDYAGNDLPTVNFVYGDTNIANRTLTILTGTAPYTVIETRSYGKHTITLENGVNEKEIVTGSGWGEKKVKQWDLEGNTLVFNSSKVVSDNQFTITDATGKDLLVHVSAIKPLEVTETEYSLVIGETVNDKLQVTGYIKNIVIKSISPQSVVSASIMNDDNTFSRNLILKGLASGSAIITITDGVVEKTIDILVKEPSPLSIKNDFNEISENSVFSSTSEFIISGGTGSYNVTYQDPDNVIKKFNLIEQKHLGQGKYLLNFERNLLNRSSQNISVTISRTDKTNDKKTFILGFEALLDIKVTINDVILPREETANHSLKTPYYFMYKSYSGANIVNIANTKSADVLNVEILKNNSSYNDFDIVESTGYGADKGTVSQKNGSNFAITILGSNTSYYGPTIKDKNAPNKSFEIRVSILE